jgi:hypothetical protein
MLAELSAGVSETVAMLHTSPYVAGIIMLFLNAGTSFLMQDIGPVAHAVFQHKWTRRLVFFAIFFTATRNLYISIVLTLLFVLIVDGFMNPHSRYYLVPRSMATTTEREARFRRNVRVLYDHGQPRNM